MPEATAQFIEGAGPAAQADEGRIGGRGAATRVRLLASAAQLIAERGWGEVTTRMVAQRAGVNAGLVHYHFGSMDALLREAALGRLEPELAGALEPLTADRPVEDALREAVAGLDHFDLASQPGILMAEVLLRATRDPAVARAMGEQITTYRTDLERRLVSAAAAGEVRSDVRPDVMAMVITATLDGLLLQRMADPQLDPAAIAAGLARLLTRGD